MQSELLTKFYQKYNKWLQKGAPHLKPFYRNAGLCWNLSAVYSQGLDPEISSKLQDELTGQFYNAGLSEFVPFNNPKFCYGEEVENYSSYKNEARRQWVKDHINLGETK